MVKSVWMYKVDHTFEEWPAEQDSELHVALWSQINFPGLSFLIFKMELMMFALLGDGESHVK